MSELRNEWEYTRNEMLIEKCNERINELVHSLNEIEGYESYLEEDSGLLLGKKEEDSWENEYQKKQEGFTWSRNPVTKTYSLNFQKNSKTSSISTSLFFLDEMGGLDEKEVQIKSAERLITKLIGIVEFLEGTKHKIDS